MVSSLHEALMARFLQGTSGIMFRLVNGENASRVLQMFEPNVGNICTRGSLGHGCVCVYTHTHIYIYTFMYLFTYGDVHFQNCSDMQISRL